MRNIHARFPATVGARRAIDPLLYFPCNPTKETLGVVVIFQKPSKAKILSLFHLREPTDLDEVGNHTSSLRLPTVRCWRRAVIAVSFVPVRSTRHLSRHEVSDERKNHKCNDNHDQANLRHAFLSAPVPCLESTKKHWIYMPMSICGLDSLNSKDDRLLYH